MTTVTSLYGPGVAVDLMSPLLEPPFADVDEAELALVADAVTARRAEFATGRACAHRALAALGIGNVRRPILIGDAREPLWPAGAVGSISHCGSWCAAAVAASTTYVSLGLDLEALVGLPDGTHEFVLTSSERRLMRDRPAGQHWDSLVFSAKESVYKAWFPIERRWLGFDEVEIHIDEASASFVAEFLGQRPNVGGVTVEAFHGRFVVFDGMVATGVSVPHPGA